MVIAGKIFAALTDKAAFAAMIGAESITIDHGKLRLEMRDGSKFEIAIKLMKE